MKMVNLLGFGLLAAITVTTIIGAGTASANTETALCKVKELVCPAGSQYGRARLSKENSRLPHELYLRARPKWNAKNPMWASNLKVRR
jgi:hypothetical protein